MLTRSQKEELVKDLANQFSEAKSIVFADYRGLSVADITNLKNELRKDGAQLRVAKKTLIDIALKEAGKNDVSVRGMEGQIAFSFSDADEVLPAKVLANFSKDNENLQILGGVLDGGAMTSEEVMALAKTPSKEELLGRLVGSLKSPMSGLVNVLNGNTRDLVQVLKAIADAKA